MISLREANDDDLELMIAWRSNPRIYSGFYLQSDPLTWHKHYAWWKSRRNRRDWIIVLQEGERARDVGSVNASSLDSDNPEVGIYIGEITAWGKGIARRAVSLALRWLQTAGYKKAHALILTDNAASIRLFEALDFKQIGEGHEGERVYELELQP